VTTTYTTSFTSFDGQPQSPSLDNLEASLSEEGIECCCWFNYPLRDGVISVSFEFYSEQPSGKVITQIQKIVAFQQKDYATWRETP